MRLIYFFLKILLQYPLRIYYYRQLYFNAPKRFFGSTIYVCNHASSFMDPLVIGVLQRPIIYFMVRSDVFTKFTIPFFNSAQMLPIYREQDGEKNNAKNDAIFKKCGEILSRNRNILIFGEGFTDDIFIRRLKPIKKGAVRIGFLTLENLNWQKKIYIATIGVNYSDPNVLFSHLVIAHSKQICLNDYKTEYLENPAKVINDINRIIEQDLQDQLTHVSDINWVFFHEHVTRLKRNGLDPYDTDFSISLLKRWENSKNLAKWMNNQNLNENQNLVQLKTDLENYFSELKEKNIRETYVHDYTKSKKFNFFELIAKLTILLPFALLGLVHFYLPYKWVKNFTERIMKRRVFWSSVKMFLGAVVISLWNIPIMMLLNSYLIHNACLSFGIYMILPFVGILAYKWKIYFTEFFEKRKIKYKDMDLLSVKRNNLLQRIDDFVKV